MENELDKRIKNFIVAVAGEELLGYMLNCDSVDARSALDDAPSDLLAVLAACCLDDAAALFSMESGQHFLSAFGDSVVDGQTVASWAHEVSGGDALEISAGDDWLSDLLAKCMVNTLPLMRARLLQSGSSELPLLLGDSQFPD